MLQSTDLIRQLGNGSRAAFGSQKTALEPRSQSETRDPEHFTTLALPVEDENLKCLGHYSFFFLISPLVKVSMNSEIGEGAARGSEEDWGGAGLISTL